jgi:hypothetical protein
MVGKPALSGASARQMLITGKITAQMALNETRG